MQKTILVTGATAGIGKAAVLALGRLGHTVIVHGRDAERAKATVRQVQRMTENEDVHWVLADLAEQAQVRRMAAEVAERFPQLQVLVNNAGIIPLEHTVTPDGLETQLAVNHLAPFLLTNLLLPTLTRNAPTRVVTVSSAAHLYARLDFDNLNSERSYGPTETYGSTKLMNVFFTFELARRLAGTGVTANCLHPGVIDTSLMQAYFGRGARVQTAAPEQGADTIVYLATDPEAETLSGKYFADRTAQPSNPLTFDHRIAAELWQRSAELTGL